MYQGENAIIMLLHFRVVKFKLMISATASNDNSTTPPTKAMDLEI